MILLLLSYLLGSIPSGILVAKAMGLGDPRDSGSGNIGASNLARLGGKRVGVFTFLLDFFKGLIPVLAALLLKPESPGLACFCALFAVLGHCYSLFLFFSGGKGVATAAGALFLIATIPMLIAFVGWAICFYCFRITSLAAMAALGLLLASLLATNADPILLGVALLCSLVVVRRHEMNLKNLL
ncbi:MAG: glycerol-3-phosphate 1-O-acyltransferase PlsY, partial [Bdellovibrionota bacterium]